jgi:hypothetical protein
VCVSFQADCVQERERLSWSYLGEKKSARVVVGTKEGHEPSDIVDPDVTIAAEALNPENVYD